MADFRYCLLVDNVEMREYNFHPFDDTISVKSQIINFHPFLFYQHLITKN